MNETPAISVIVAVYKAENYLRKCLDSLRAQTFKDFEVLLVDDGSPDGSGAICDEYAARDPRFRVFHKENGGVSSARQFGMDHARGEYTIHADPDDWVEPDMLAELYAKARADQADMVICDYYVDRGGRSRRVLQRPSALDHETVLRELFQQLHGSCWNKLVRRSCYKNIHFPLGINVCEDLYVNSAVLLQNIKISYLNQAFYHYVQYINAHSLVRSYSISSYNHDIQICNLLCGLLADTNCADACRKHMYAFIIYRAFIGHCFNSVEYKKYCKQYSQIGLTKIRHDSAKMLYPFIKISCMGFYGLAYKCYSVIKFLYIKLHRL